MQDGVKSENQNNTVQPIRIVLNSQNSKPIRNAMDELSAQLMKKNRKLYERLAYR